MPAHHPHLSRHPDAVGDGASMGWIGSFARAQAGVGRGEKVKVERFILELLRNEPAACRSGAQSTFEGGAGGLHNLPHRGRPDACLARVLWFDNISTLSGVDAPGVVVWGFAAAAVAAEIERMCGMDRRDALLRLEGWD